MGKFAGTGVAVGCGHCGHVWRARRLGYEVRCLEHDGSLHGPARHHQLLARHVHLAAAHRRTLPLVLSLNVAPLS